MTYNLVLWTQDYILTITAAARRVQT